MHAPPSSTRAHAQGVSPAAGAYSDSEDDLPQQTGNGQASRLIRQPSGSSADTQSDSEDGLPQQTGIGQTSRLISNSSWSNADSDLPTITNQSSTSSQVQQPEAHAPVTTATLLSFVDSDGTGPAPVMHSAPVTIATSLSSVDSDDSGPAPVTHGAVQTSNQQPAGSIADQASNLQSKPSEAGSMDSYPLQACPAPFEAEAGDVPAPVGFNFEADFVADVNAVLDSLQSRQHELQSDATASQMLAKVQQFWDKLQAASVEQADLFFLFKDGPVTKAAKLGQPLFLEDFDMPSQAATERLNSLLESEPTFAVTEDVTYADAQTASVSLPTSFQVFASVHNDKSGQAINISAATKSRFTEIHVTQYSEAELQQMIRDELQYRLPGMNLPEKLVDWMFAMRQLWLDTQGSSGRAASDISQLIHWVNLIETQSRAPVGQEPILSWEARVLLGARFLYFEQGHTAAQAKISEAYPKIFGTSSTPAWVGNMFGEPCEADLFRQTPFILAQQGQSLQLRYTQVAAKLGTAMPLGADVREDLVVPRMFCAVTSTLIKNIASIFAALSAQSPLLLEGPPGIGKTAVITQASFLSTIGLPAPPLSPCKCISFKAFHCSHYKVACSICAVALLL